MSYIGNEPIVSATRTVTEITATAGQTVFTANGGYTVGYLDVFVNGAQLQTSDFTATNGSSVTLSSPAVAGDDIRLVAWGTFLTSGAASTSYVDAQVATKLNSANPSYTGTLTGGTGVVNIGSGQFVKDANGMVGIGKTPEQTSGVAIELGGSANNNAINFLNSSNVQGWITSNAYYNGTNWLRKYGSGTTSTAYATNVNGEHVWYTAGGGTAGGTISWSERMRVDASGNLLFNSGFGSAATAYGCRAWVNFNGTGTVAIRASGNVSSITDNGTGDYTVNFSTAMPDANYSAAGFGQAGGGYAVRISNSTQPTASAFRFSMLDPGVSVSDTAMVHVNFFR